MHINNGYMYVYRLTAFVLKSFAQVKEHIFVSNTVLYNAARWIVKYQNSDGSFQSVGAVHSTSLRVSSWLWSL